MPSSRVARVKRAATSDGSAATRVLGDSTHRATDLELVTGVTAHVDRSVRGTRTIGTPHLHVAPHADAPVLHVDAWAESPARIGWRSAVKRSIDVVGAVVGLAVTSPLVAVFAVMMRVTSPGPLFFAHTRVGRDGRRFRCYKIRTMCADAESQLLDDPSLHATYRANGYKLPSHADARVTPLGRFMRMSSLDELPQFWNVLRGDMALVGPRPIVDGELEHYAPRDRRLLLSVRPGITGAWAVSGRSRIGYPLRAEMELEYVRRWSAWRDLTILVRTVAAVVVRRGAS